MIYESDFEKDQAKHDVVEAITNEYIEDCFGGEVDDDLRKALLYGTAYIVHAILCRLLYGEPMNEQGDLPKDAANDGLDFVELKEVDRKFWTPQELIAQAESVIFADGDAECDDPKCDCHTRDLNIH
jgi:hypothetical protein